MGIRWQITFSNFTLHNFYFTLHNNKSRTVATFRLVCIRMLNNQSEFSSKISQLTIEKSELSLAISGLVSVHRELSFEISGGIKQ